MALLKTNFAPPFNITRISHIALTSVDLDASQFFYEAGLGLEVTFRDSKSLFLRAVEETSHHSLVFHKIPIESDTTCLSVSYRVQTNEDLNKAHAYFSARGIDTNFVDRPFQDRTLQVKDGVGVPLEFCAEIEQSMSRLQSFNQQSGGKLAFFDHIQISIPDVKGAYEWYTELGFRLSEYTAIDGTDELWGIWLKRKNNTQDVVFANGAGPRLHHFAYHTPEISNVIHAADVMASLGLAGSMDRAPGRHGIGNAFFIYFRDPDGHRVEIFTSHYNFIDANQVPKRWELSDTRRSQLWGFPAPRRWFYEATAFDSVPIHAPKMSVSPMTLEDFLAKGS